VCPPFLANEADYSDVSLHFSEVTVPHRPLLDLEGVSSMTYTAYMNNSIYQLHNCLIMETENSLETLDLDREMTWPTTPEYFKYSVHRHSIRSLPLIFRDM
jgi:hypothetical protein